MLQCTVGEKEPITKKVPIIFPSFMIHEDIAKSAIDILTNVHKFNDVKVISGGDIGIDYGSISCDGRSTTLKVSAHEDDSHIIDMYDYFGGVI